MVYPFDNVFTVSFSSSSYRNHDSFLHTYSSLPYLISYIDSINFFCKQVSCASYLLIVHLVLNFHEIYSTSDFYQICALFKSDDKTALYQKQ